MTADEVLADPGTCCTALVARYGLEDARLFAALLVDALDLFEQDHEL